MRKKSSDIVIIGAGLCGSTIAERLANKENRKVIILEKRNHIGGNVYDFYNDNHILIHKYGPHIFHTSNEEVFAYLSQFTEWIKYKHRVLTFVRGKYLPIPINLTTINKFFGAKLKTEKEVKEFLEKKRNKGINKIKNSRDVIVSKYGEELYNAFIKNYTKKQWDLYPEELDKEVLERLPVRYNENPYYFDDKYQCMPKHGYTEMINKMLNNKNIKIHLKTDYKKSLDKLKFSKLIVTSPIDEFFDYKFGRLKYRCIDFQFETFAQESYQENSVINYPNDYEFTRITEFNKLTFQMTPKTTICKEYTSWKGERCYPVPHKEEKQLFKKYLTESKKLDNIFFAGRLGSYKYLDMDEAVENALNLYKRL